ncbi:MAG: hypothetical protein WAO11_04370, partial [Candidatus Acidiferrum sp.]
MRWKLAIAAAGVCGVVVSGVAWAQRAEFAYAQRAEFGSAAGYFDTSAPQNQTDQTASSETITGLVGRLELERYKATIKGLTQFGDRRQGTDRNRKAVDWIEAQLKSYGCANTERLKYDYEPGPPRARRTPPPPGQTP